MTNAINQQDPIYNLIGHEHYLYDEDKSHISDRVMHVLEKVSMVAVGILAAVTSMPLFVTSFALGTAIGIWNGKKSNTEEDHDHQALCSHGLMERLTGVKMPAPLALTANVAILVAHVDHHPFVFVPIVGVTLGILSGQSIAPRLNSYCETFRAKFIRPRMEQLGRVLTGPL